MRDNPSIPVVLVFAGNDPTGGAGIAADIEAIASMGAHAAPVITTVTVQDTQDVKSYFPLGLSGIVEQARAILEDMPVASVKIGMLGSLEAIEAINSILVDYPEIPVVLDPIVSAGGGASLVDGDMLDALCDLLIPKTTIITPNSVEARLLAREADVLEACAQEIMDIGAEYVLLTGSHEQTEKVENYFYGNGRLIDSFDWERLPHTFHGSGCTLASCIAGLLAHRIDPLSAVYEAQEFTWKSLEAGYRLGMGQLIPNRFFWAVEEEEVVNPE